MTEELKVGDPIILTKSIYDDGEDHHPPGYIAFEDETVYVKEIRQKCLVVAHKGNSGGFFISKDEYKRVT